MIYNILTIFWYIFAWQEQLNTLSELLAAKLKTTTAICVQRKLTHSSFNLDVNVLKSMLKH